MKVLAIGGGGSMGRATVRTALQFDFVNEIVIAGIDFERSTRFAASLGDSRVRAIFLDVTDESALRAAIRSVNVVLNSAGPFFRFGYPVLNAAIDEGRHYCDICDDWEPTLRMLSLHEKAKQCGVTAVIGLGASPGIANMLALKAGTALDEVEELVSAWKLSGAVNVDDGFTDPIEAGRVDAAAIHLMHCLAERIRVVRDGKVQDVKALEQACIDYPGFGAIDVWSIGHPEAVTLPRHFLNLRTCYNGMHGVAVLVDGLRTIAEEVRTKRITIEAAAQLLAGDGGRQARQERLAQTERADTPGIFAFASGKKNGKKARAGAHIKHVPVGGMAAVTGIPHALFLPLLHQGKLNKAGVFAPEEIVDVDVFFSLLDGFCGPEGAGLVLNVT